MKSKYHATKVYMDGIRFDSKAEAKRYVQLRDLQEQGVISNLELQPEYEILPAHRKNGHAVRRMTYRADFRYQTDGITIVEDVKGMETEAFKIKKKLVEYFYPEVSITLVRAK